MTLHRSQLCQKPLERKRDKVQIFCNDRVIHESFFFLFFFVFDHFLPLLVVYIWSFTPFQCLSFILEIVCFKGASLFNSKDVIFCPLVSLRCKFIYLPLKNKLLLFRQFPTIDKTLYFCIVLFIDFFLNKIILLWRLYQMSNISDCSSV